MSEIHRFVRLGEKATPATLVFKNQRYNFLGRGQECQGVYRVTQPVFDSSDTSTLAFKKMAHPDKITAACQAYRVLRDIQAPVPDRYEKVIENNRPVGIVMTDLTENGQKLLITSNGLRLESFKYLRRRNPDLAHQFLSLDLNDPIIWDNLDRQISAIADLTAQNGVLLEGLDIAGILVGMSQLEVILFDYGQVKVNGKIDPVKTYHNNRDHLSNMPYLMQEAQDIAAMA